MEQYKDSKIPLLYLSMSNCTLETLFTKPHVWYNSYLGVFRGVGEFTSIALQLSKRKALTHHKTSRYIL